MKKNTPLHKRLVGKLIASLFIFSFTFSPLFPFLPNLIAYARRAGMTINVQREFDASPLDGVDVSVRCDGGSWQSIGATVSGSLTTSATPVSDALTNSASGCGDGSVVDFQATLDGYVTHEIPAAFTISFSKPQPVTTLVDWFTYNYPTINFTVSDALLFSHSITVTDNSGKGGTPVIGATIDAGSAVCVEQGTGVYLCPITIANDGSSVNVSATGYITGAIVTGDRGAGTDSQSQDSGILTVDTGGGGGGGGPTGDTYRFVKWQVTKKKGVGGCAGYTCIQVDEFQLTSNSSVVSWPSGTVATNPNGANPGGQGPDMAIDSSSTYSKWLDFNFNTQQKAVTGESTLIIDTGSGNSVTFDGYKWTTGDDSSERDPVSWKLYGSNDGVIWTLIDTRNDETITKDRNTDTSIYSLTTSINAPGSPTDLQQVGITPTSVILFWNSPIDTGGDTITDFVPEYSIHHADPVDDSWTVFDDGVGALENLATVSGLAPATEYDFRISAVNSNGIGTPSSIFTASTTAPLSLSFASPTLADATTTYQNSFDIKMDSTALDGEHYAFTDLNHSVLGWWRFENNADTSINVTNGTWGGTEAYASGKFGTAAVLNGTDNYIDVQLPNPVTDHFTLSAWVYLNSYSPGQALFSDENGHLIQIGGQGQWQFNDFADSVTADTGVWTHVVGVYDNGAETLYINGTPHASSSAVRGLAQDINIGRRMDGLYIDGKIDDAIIFDRSLSSAEVASLYNASATQYNATFASLPDSNYTFKGYAVDVDNNEAETAERTITVDAQPNGTAITSCADFENINNALGDTYYLADDLDCTGEGNTIIVGSGADPFTGIFNGYGHTIKVNIDSTDNYVGLFSTTQNATISNLRTDGSIISTGSYVGGIVGAADNTIFEKVANNVDVRADTNVGGIVGYGNSITINNSYNRGAISISGLFKAGGIVGVVQGTSRINKVYNSGAIGRLSDAGFYIGGLVGWRNFGDTQISNSFNVGKVSSTYPTHVNAITGVDIPSTDTLEAGYTNNFYDITRSGQTLCSHSNTGVALESVTDQCQGVNSGSSDTNYFKSNSTNKPFSTNTDSQNDWDFGGTWDIVPGGYPSLQIINNDSYVANDFDGGDGSEGDPYQISSCVQLQSIDNISSNLSLHYILTGDVDCSDTKNWNSGSGFDPIGTVTLNGLNIYSGFTMQSFSGTLDGQGHKITGLFIHRGADANDVNGYYMGLFSTISAGASVSNLGLEDVDITGSGNNVGALAGGLSGTVTHVYSTGTVNGNSRVGGLVGVHVDANNFPNSSPLVYTWNGEKYVYTDDVGGILPKELDGVDIAQIDSKDIAPKEGKYSIKVSEEYNEIVYYDEMALMTFDHQPGYSVVEPLDRTAGINDLRTVSNTPTNPLVSCTDESGNDCLENLSSYDDKWSYRNENGVYDTANLKKSFILDFGDIDTSSSVQLVLRGARDYAASAKYPRNSNRSIQVKDAQGKWVEIYNKNDLGSDGSPRLRTIDLTGKFLSSDHHVKVAFDTFNANYFAVDTSPQVSFTTNTYHPTSANLGYHGFTDIDHTYYFNHDYYKVSPAPEGIYKNQYGNFTKYGDVTPLLNSPDDHPVIMRYGDEISAEFPYVAPETGMERSFMLYNDAVYKHATNDNLGVLGQSAGYLPYHGMTKYSLDMTPYPNTQENNDYIKTWNTRVIDGPFADANRPNSSTIIESYSTAAVNGSYSVGGLVGENGKLISNSYATGNINGLAYVGGIAGLSFGGTIENSYATGDVTSGGGGFSGAGLVGYIYNTSVSNSFSASHVSGFSSYPGGLFGYNWSNTISNNFYDKNNSGGASCTGTDGDIADCSAVNADGTDSNYFKNNASNSPLDTWDFATTPIWDVVGNGYPSLHAISADNGPAQIFDGGSGSSGSPYQISSCASLASIGTTYLTSNFSLTADLDCTTTGSAVMIGDDSHSYSGVFEGNGHTINVNINEPSTNTVALFRGVDGGTVRDLRVAGRVLGNNLTAGLVAFANNATITKTINSAYVHGNAGGGLVGELTGGSVVSDSYNEGTVVMIGIGGGQSGGLVMSIDGGASIVRSYSSGNFVSGAYEVGPLAGSNDGIITDSFGAGSFSSTALLNGGISGQAGTTGSVSLLNTYWDIDTTGQSNCAQASDGSPINPSGCVGISGQPEYFKNNSSNAPFNDGLQVWDFDTVWNTSSGYPILRNVYSDGPSAVPPEQVDSLSATAASSSEIDLSWKAPSDNGYAITGYKIERESPVGGGFGVVVANTGTTDLSYADTGLSASTEYNYRVTAINAGGEGAPSSEANVTTNGTGGGGPYFISSCSDFEAINNNLSGLYVLTANLSCDGEGNAIMVGTGDPFTGIFDGGDYSISIALDGTNGTLTNLGLFARTDGATIENLTVTGSLSSAYGMGSLVSTANNTHFNNVHASVTMFVTKNNNGGPAVGGLVGDLEGGSLIEKSSAAGSIVAYDSTTFLGGLVGVSFGSNIYTSYAKVSVISQSTNLGCGVGGFIGCVLSGAQIDQSFSNGNVSAQNSTGGFAGGVGGANISNSYSTGNVSGDNTIGGFAGWVQESQIAASYASGSVTGDDGPNGGGGLQGGFAGIIQDATVYSSFSTGLVSHVVNEYGGFTGQIAGLSSVANNFYDQTTSGQTICSVDGDSMGCAGVNTVSAPDANYFKENSTNPPFDHDWDFSETPIWDTAVSSLPILHVYSANVQYVSPFSGGDGSSGNPYQITSCAQLQAINTSRSSRYILENDIDCSGTTTWNPNVGEWVDGVVGGTLIPDSYGDVTHTNIVVNNNGYFGFEPIGSNGPAFTGAFDGNGKTISNLWIFRKSTGENGIFGIADTATITNVTIADSNVVGGGNTGALVGHMIGGTISNVTLSNNMVRTYLAYDGGGLAGRVENNAVISSVVNTGGVVHGSGDIIGGLVGSLYGSTLQDSSSSADVDGGLEIGGVIGEGVYATITHTYSAGGTVTSNRSEYLQMKTGYNAGGFTGYLYMSTVSDSYSTETVDSSGYYAAGFAGYTYGTTITNSYATGSVTARAETVGDNEFTPSYVGGFIGQLNNTTTTNTFASGAVSSPGDYVGGYAGSTVASTIHDAYATGAVSGSNYVGGFSGEIQSSYDIARVYSIGLVMGTDAGTTGGLVGTNDDSGTIVDSFWNVNTTNQSLSAGGTSKSLAEMESTPTYTDASWDFNTIWGQDNVFNGGYPTFLFYHTPSFGDPVMVKDINLNGGSDVDTMTIVNGIAYFNANDGVHGYELWKSDGTDTGTVMIKDINPGAGDSYPYFFTNLNGVVYFQAYDGSNGYELWKSDGTEEGTVMVKDINPGAGDSSPSNFVNVNGVLFFQANDGVHGPELWKSDGTESGTVMVKDINPGSDGSYFYTMIGSGSTFYFAASDGVHGYELWKSDGTEEGTVMVKDINPDADSYPWLLTNVNGTIFFQADDGVHGYELWKTDGTEEGTVMVKDIYIDGASNPDYLTAFNGEVYFQADDGVHSYELWKSDGTEEGTVMVKDINPDGNSNPRYFAVVGNTLYFQATDGVHGRELWKSDGTEEGTVMVKDINSEGNSNPQYFTDINGVVYFRASDNIYGNELWKSDGTEEGTVMVKDINTSGSSYPYDFVSDGDVLYFVATDNTHGSELWKLDTSSDTSDPTITSISSTLSDGVYGVGQVVDVHVTFSKPVSSTGDISLSFDTGRSCAFTITSSTTATCDYTIQAGDSSDDFTVSSVSGVIKDASLHSMTNFTPVVNLAANNNIVVDTLSPQTPIASVAAGAYTKAQSVTLSSASSTSIRYSLVDTPSDCASGTLYNGVIAISSSATIYARACKTTNNTYSVASFAYTISVVVPGTGGGGGFSSVRAYTAPAAVPQSPVVPVQQTPVVPPVPVTPVVPATVSTVSSARAPHITAAGLPKGFQFTKNLKPKTTSGDIKNLQIFLNNNGFLVSTKGVGSKGKENDYMGVKTKAALIKFQEKYAKEILVPQGLKKGTGVLGPYTRKVLNAWLKKASR